jgi:transcriptional regulator with XRE-family HTH domain
MAKNWLLKDLRTELRLDQTDIATASGISQIRISELERGVGDEPTPEERDSIVKALVKYAIGRGMEMLAFSGRN